MSEDGNLPNNIVGIGTDIVECLRIAQMIERHGDLFINRVYTPLEIGYCQSRKASTQHYAGRWAAKEAILKAIGTGWRRGISLARRRSTEQQIGPPRGRHAWRGTRRRGTPGHPQDSGLNLALPQPRHGLRDRHRPQA